MELDLELEQDEWSLSKPRFGEEGQLTVVGWKGRIDQHKVYILKCDECSKDSELFGLGHFKSLKSNLIKGRVPCGCSKAPRWTEEQYHVLCSRKADELGFKFLGFSEEWKAAHTKVKMLCIKHGQWETGSINSILDGKGCPGCRTDKSTPAAHAACKKSEEEMSESFIASGAFHPDTKFWRSERKSKSGSKPYWYMSCPECGETGESQSGNLQRGLRPCACSSMRQQEAYIHLIQDSGFCVGVKFGVSRNSSERIKQQGSKCLYDLVKHSVYHFDSVESCKAAERECRQKLETRVISRVEMPDGWTETTWLYNIDKIIEIYKKHGGVVETAQELPSK